MTQLSQTDSSGTSTGTGELTAFAPVACGGFLQAQPDTCAECVSLDFIGKGAGSAGPNVPRNSPAQKAEEETEYLLKLVASLEACNMALLNKLNLAERELAALRKGSTHLAKQAP